MIENIKLLRLGARIQKLLAKPAAGRGTHKSFPAGADLPGP